MTLFFVMCLSESPKKKPSTYPINILTIQTPKLTSPTSNSSACRVVTAAARFKIYENNSKNKYLIDVHTMGSVAIVPSWTGATAGTTRRVFTTDTRKTNVVCACREQWTATVTSSIPCHSGRTGSTTITSFWILTMHAWQRNLDVSKWLITKKQFTKKLLCE